MANLRAHQRRILSVVDPCTYTFRYGAEPSSLNLRYDQESQSSSTIGLRNRHVWEMIAGFTRILNSGNGTDMTIICGTESRYFHKAIVCSRSDYFSKALEGNFKEAQTGLITLHDPPVLVWKMMQYFYTLDYSVFDGAEQQPPNKFLWSLQVHANMFNMADKYQIEALKLLSAERFTNELCREFGSGDTRFNQSFQNLMNIFEFVCEGSETTHNYLQEAVMATVLDYIEVLLPMPEFKDVLLRVPEIGFKIVSKQVEQRQKQREAELNKESSLMSW